MVHGEDDNEDDDEKEECLELTTDRWPSAWRKGLSVCLSVSGTEEVSNGRRDEWLDVFPAARLQVDNEKQREDLHFPLASQFPSVIQPPLSLAKAVAD